MTPENQWNLDLWYPENPQKTLDLDDMEIGASREVTDILSQSIEKLEVKSVFIVWEKDIKKYWMFNVLRITPEEVLEQFNYWELTIKTIWNKAHSYTVLTDEIFLPDNEKKTSFLELELSYLYYSKRVTDLLDMTLSVHWDDLYYVSFTYVIDWVQKTWNVLVSNSREKIEWFLKK